MISYTFVEWSTIFYIICITLDMDTRFLNKKSQYLNVIRSFNVEIKNQFKKKIKTLIFDFVDEYYDTYIM